jgi:hypothetical protein
MGRAEEVVHGLLDLPDLCQGVLAVVAVPGRWIAGVDALATGEERREPGPLALSQPLGRLEPVARSSSLDPSLVIPSRFQG